MGRAVETQITIHGVGADRKARALHRDFVTGEKR